MTKSESMTTPEPRDAGAAVLGSFGIRSCFGFRYSDFGFRISFVIRHSSFPRQPMELESHRLASLRVQHGRQIPAVLQQLDARQRRTEPHVEGPPAPGLIQGGAQPFGGVAQETDSGQTRQDPALPKNQVGMQMADDGVLNLRQPGADRVLAPEERQGGR